MTGSTFGIQTQDKKHFLALSDLSLGLHRGLAALLHAQSVLSAVVSYPHSPVHTLHCPPLYLGLLQLPPGKVTGQRMEQGWLYLIRCPFLCDGGPGCGRGRWNPRKNKNTPSRDCGQVIFSTKD